MKFLVRVRVTRVHEHLVVASDAQEAEEIAVDDADEGSVRDCFDACEFLDAVEVTD